MKSIFEHRNNVATLQHRAGESFFILPGLGKCVTKNFPRTLLLLKSHHLWGKRTRGNGFTLPEGRAGWDIGKELFPGRVLSPGTGCPEQLWLPLDPWKCPRPGWTGLGTPWDSGRCRPSFRRKGESPLSMARPSLSRDTGNPHTPHSSPSHPTWPFLPQRQQYFDAQCRRSGVKCPFAQL